jgi:UDP-GlcNAc:undecaprenyl-phosphate/decaprenyl-phosphate GlcNAc-1-phosphate transferase
MSLSAFLSHLGFALALCLLSAFLTRLMIVKFRIMDVPNRRSSHATPTPKSGGVSIVATFLAGAIALFFFAEKTMIRQDFFWGFVLSALLIAAMSLYDDIKSKSLSVKLVTQIVAVCAVLSCGILIDEISVPVYGSVSLGALAYALSFLWVLGLTNAFNFIDGLDGLAAGIAVIVSVFFCVITFNEGSTFVYITCYTVFAGAFGFLIYNLPPARIFMGDVGSAFLGFTFAVLAIIASRYDRSHTSFLVMPLLLFNVIYDTLFTFIRRLWRRERVFEAHRTHLYQLFHRLGYAHRTVSYFYYAMCVLQGIAAVLMVNVSGSQRLLVFVPFFVIQVAYSYVVIRRATRAGLLG